MTDAQVALNQRRLAAYYNPAPVLREFMWKRDDKALPLRCVLEYVDNGTDDRYWVVREVWAGEHNVTDLFEELDRMVRISDEAEKAFRKEDEQINAERRAERREYAYAYR